MSFLTQMNSEIHQDTIYSKRYDLKWKKNEGNKIRVAYADDKCE